LKIFPNPFYQSASITWALTKGSFVSLKILDFTGREIETLVNQKLDSGNHQVIFKASNLPAGIYFYQLKVNGVLESGKLVVCK